MKIALQTIASMLFGLAFFGVALFLPARTFDYWQAWVFIAVFIAASLISVSTWPCGIRPHCSAG